jgi:osomolarity two-component system sensor histidine kinase SLN1
MVKMRIPIREQLGCLVLLASLIGLAVIAIATWVAISMALVAAPGR